jgi:hypothetical protein
VTDAPNGEPAAVPPGMVDLRPCKRGILRLPANHPNRIAILAEPDFLTWEEAVAKVQVWLRIAMSWAG